MNGPNGWGPARKWLPALMGVLWILSGGCGHQGLPECRVLAEGDVLPMPPDPDGGSDAFRTWLAFLGQPLQSAFSSRPASYGLFLSRRFLLYGEPEDVPGNTLDPASGRMRFLGFDSVDFPVEDPEFPLQAGEAVPDSPAALLSCRGRFSPHPGLAPPSLSWLPLTDRQRTHLAQAPLRYRAMGGAGLTLSALGLGAANCQILQAPTCSMGFIAVTSLPGPEPGTTIPIFLGGPCLGRLDPDLALSESSPPPGGLYVLPSGADRLSVPVSAMLALSGTAGGRLEDLDRSQVSVGFVGTPPPGAAAPGLGQAGALPAALAWDPAIPAASIPADRIGTWDLVSEGHLLSRYGDVFRATARLQFRAIRALPSSPAAVTVLVLPDIDAFQNQVDALDRFRQDLGSRFLCLETVTVLARFRNVQDRVVFRPDALLGAETFVDANGHVYRSPDFIPGGQPFPFQGVVYPAPGQSIVSCRFTIPLVPATIGWNGVRRRPAYTFFVTGTRGGVTTNGVATGIEITGTVFDIAHIQPESLGKEFAP